MINDNSSSKQYQSEDINKSVFINRLLTIFPEVENNRENRIIDPNLTKLNQVLTELLEKQKDWNPKLIVEPVSKLLEQQYPALVTGFSAELINVLSLIDRLFDYILDEKHLPQELRLLIGRLRPSFFKIALTDQTLFFDSTHPCRVLINEMTKLALLWSETDPKTFVIYTQLNNIVESILNAQTSQNIGIILSAAINNLNLFSIGFIKKVDIFEKRIREAEEGKAKSLAAMSLARNMIADITQKKNIPGFVLNFLKEAWQHVIFLENIKSIEDEQGQALLTAKQLLVSLQPIKSEQALQKYLALLAPLIKRIEPELTKTSLSQSESTVFMQNLCDYHKNLISVAKSTFDRENASDSIIRLKPAVNFETQVMDKTQEELPSKPVSEMALDEWVEFMFDGIANSAQNSSKDESSDINLDFQKNKLRKQALSKLLIVGHWFEILINGIYSRCKLASYITQNDMYIFVSGSGNKVAEFDSESIDKAIQNKEIKKIEDTPLFEKAFELVSSEAEHEHHKEIKKKQLKAKIEEEQKKLKAIEIARIEKLKNDEILRITKEKEKIAQQEANLIKNENEKVIQHIDQLSIGSWVEIRINDGFQKCRLAAKIASSNKFIFVDRNGVKVKELLEHELNLLYDTGQIKIKRKIDVFDSALASVITNMREQKQ